MFSVIGEQIRSLSSKQSKLNYSRTIDDYIAAVVSKASLEGPLELSNISLFKVYIEGWFWWFTELQ